MTQNEVMSVVPTVSLVLPTYKEAGNLASVIERIDAVLAADGLAYEIIVVDDDSPDRTWELAEKLAAERFPHLRVIRRIGERGLATAVIRGWAAARGEILAVMDADGQHPPETLCEVISRVRSGADLCVGSRHVQGGGVSDWSAVRRFLSRGAQMLALVLVPSVASRVSDPMSGFFALRRSVIAGQQFNPVGYKILLEVLGCGRYEHLDEVGYVFAEREAGQSKVTSRQYIEYLQHILRLAVRTGELYRFVQFGLVGSSGVLVNLAVLWFAREGLGLPLWLGGLVAVEAAILSNFLLNDNWTFKEATRALGSPPWWVRLARFNAICALGALLNVGVLLVLTNLFGWYYMLAQLAGIGVSLFWNYTLNAAWNWRPGVREATTGIKQAALEQES